ncbi:MAG TPA: hypothetical protein VFS17_04525 [Methylophilaceae bacterium]|nr:hypothetical protein [Methylophilaceae bacterium]
MMPTDNSTIYRLHQTAQKRSTVDAWQEMDVSGSPEVTPLPIDRALDRGKDIEYLKQCYTVAPKPEFGHQLHGWPQPNPWQKPIDKAGDVMHGYHGG